MSDLKIRSTRLRIEKHRLDKEVYRVDFAGGASPRLAASESLVSGSVAIVRYRGSTPSDVTEEFAATGSTISGTVATGAQVGSALVFTLAAAATGEQDADETYYARVEAETSARTMISIHKLLVYELGDESAP